LTLYSTVGVPAVESLPPAFDLLTTSIPAGYLPEIAVVGGELSPSLADDDEVLAPVAARGARVSHGQGAGRLNGRALGGATVERVTRPARARPGWSPGEPRGCQKLIHAGHATIGYSWINPPSRSARRRLCGVDVDQR